MNNKYIQRLGILIILLMFCICAPLESVEKTFTNRDVEALKNQTRQTIPTYQKRPEIPPTSGTSKSGALIVKKYLPYKDWEEEYREYFKRHYNDPSLELNPKMIVLHYSGTKDFATLWWTYINGGKYPSGDEKMFGHLSTHFVVDKDGSIYQLMPLNRRARGTYGVNHVAVSIEIIGKNEQELLANQKQMRVAFALVKWLMNQYKIPASGVRSHEEVAEGKRLVPEYTDYADTRYPTRYPPNSNARGPGKTYMFKLRYYLHEPR